MNSSKTAGKAPEVTIRDAAQALLDAFGGNTPSWLREEAVALANALAREGAVDKRKPLEIQISVKFSYFDADLLACHLTARDAGDLSSVEKQLEAALLNPTNRPEKAGYRIVESFVSRIENHKFALTVRAQVAEDRKLAEEAGEEYRRCWGEPDHELSVGEQLYEVLVASNANPSPLDIGIELISWNNDTLAIEADRKLPETLNLN